MNSFGENYLCCCPCCSTWGGQQYRGDNVLSNQVMRMILVPGDSAGNVSTDTRLNVSNVLLSINAGLSTMQFVDRTLSVPLNAGGHILYWWDGGAGWFNSLKVVPEGNFQPGIFYVPADPMHGFTNFILVPSGNEGFVNSDHMQQLDNMLNVLGTDPAAMQNMNTILTEMAPLSTTMLSNEQNGYGLILIKIPGSFQPQMLSVPWLNGLGNRGI